MVARKVTSHHVLFGILAIAAAIVIICGATAATIYASYSYTRSTKKLTAEANNTVIPNHSDLPRHDVAAPPVVPDVRIPTVENGMAPVVTSLPTNQPVVFLGIDDGQHKTGDELKMMQDNNVKATLFLADLFIRDDPNFFKSFASAGMPIEDHTLNHNINMVTTMNYEQQKAEICNMADYEEKEYGRRPILFRPPGGAYSDTMRRAAADCGMKAIVTWIAKANGGSMQYQYGDHLRKGDVVLMHFRPEFKQDMQSFIDATKSQGLHTELIENWLPQ